MKKLFIFLIIAAVAVYSGCTAVPETSPSPDTSPAPAPDVLPAMPVLSDDLKRDCLEFSAGSLQVGELAIDFTLKDIHGTELTLSQLVAEKPVVMVFGSYT